MYQDDYQLEKNDGSGIVIADYLKLIKSNWYWFVISVILCFAVAGIYLMATPDIYKRNAQILIKEDSKQGGTGADEMAILNDINFFTSRTNVNNEVEIIHSKRIMQDVVKKLDLDISYRIKSRIGRADVYSQTPVKVKFPDAEEGESFSLTMTLLSREEVKVTDLVQNSEKLLKDPIVVKILDTVVTPVGRMIIMPTLHEASNFINKPIFVKKSPVKQAAESLKNRIKVEMNKNNTVITLSLSDNSAVKADEILNTLLAIYNDDNIEYRNQVVVNTSNFISDRLKIIEEDLRNIDMDISTYKSSNFVADLQASTEQYMVESSSYNKQVFDLENQLTIAGSIREYLTNPINNYNLIPSNSGLESGSVEKEIGDYNNSMLRLNRLIENGAEKSPTVTEITSSLIEMKQSIIRSIDNLILVLELQLEGYKNRESQTNQKIANIPEKQMEMTVIERRLKIQENLYLYLLQKREENELAGAITTSNFRVVDSANGSSVPISPKKSLIMLIAFAIGLIIPCVIFWIRESLNTTVRNPKEITDKLTIPFIGTIPLLRDKKKNRTKGKRGEKDNYTIVIKDNSRDALSESFRIVRTNMDFMSVNGEKSQVIMITSFNIGSGKSFTSLNLAMSFALTGKKVVLVDLDLRKAIVSKYIDSPPIGVSGYLSSINLDLDEIIVKGNLHDNLDVVPVGTLPPNPAELLLSDKLQKLIGELRERYDYIFLDITPVNILADAYIVGKVVDMTIFIIREGLLDRRMLPELESIYKSGKLKNMAVILNGVTNSSRHYGYNYGYGYGYGYGHKYGY